MIAALRQPLLESMALVGSRHRQEADPATGSSHCTCGEWAGPFTMLRGEDDPERRGYSWHISSVLVGAIDAIIDQAYEIGYGEGESNRQADYDAVLAEFTDWPAQVEVTPQAIADRLNGLQPAPAQEQQEIDEMDVDPHIVETILVLVQEEFPADLPTEEQISQWSPETRWQVSQWASAVHLTASDNEGIEIPSLPMVLR